MIPVLLVVAGVALFAAGLVLSPAPWLALLWIGGWLIAPGLLVDFGRDDT